MSCNCGNTADAAQFPCHCDDLVFPVPLNIGAGLTDIPRQIGGFLDFRRDMLYLLRSKAPLAAWHATKPDDMGLMLLEMWAYVCDVVSFYDKVIAEELYLGTASQRTSLRKLVALLGYLPAPAVGAMAQLAAKASGQQLLKIPAGTAFRSGSFNGNPPQVFELGVDTVIDPAANSHTVVPPGPGIVSADYPDSLLLNAGLLPNPGDPVLLVDMADASRNLGLVVSGTANVGGFTQISFTTATNLLAGKALNQLQLFLARNTANINTEVSASTVYLDTVTRLLRIGDPVLVSGAKDLRWFSVTGAVQATVAGAGISVTVGGTLFTTPGPGTQTTQVSFDAALTDTSRGNPGINGGAPADWSDPVASQLILHFNLQSLGVVAELPLPPVQVAGNLLGTSRGQTVTGEVLGNGDPTQASQTFKLQKKPLTYLPSLTAMNNSGVRDTLTVYVDGVRWTEVSTFYGQGINDQVYIVRQDDGGDSWVIFGDGVRGQRLPGGTNNIIGNYRYGAGAAEPPAAGITQIAKAIKGLASVSNPAAASGGADAEGPDTMRSGAPKTALILGRAVSMDDMEAVALVYPGVVTAQAEWGWVKNAQAALAHIWYIGDPGIADSLYQRLKSLSDPTVLIQVDNATPVPVTLGLSVDVDPRYVEADVHAAVQAALSTGLLAEGALGIGRPFFRSQLFEAVLEVAGTTAVSGVFWNGVGLDEFAKAPGSGNYFLFTISI